jgi:hypothetical protein
MNEPPSLLRNDISGTNHWLTVQLVGTVSNRSATGSRVIARYGGRQQAQEVLAQSSFYSSNDPRLHFGLGAETSVDLTIRWTSGAVEDIPRIKSNRFITIREGKGIVRVG